jgi:hypothetical protein
MTIKFAHKTTNKEENKLNQTTKVHKKKNERPNQTAPI